MMIPALKFTSGSATTQPTRVEIDVNALSTSSADTGGGTAVYVVRTRDLRAVSASPAIVHCGTKRATKELSALLLNPRTPASAVLAVQGEYSSAAQLRRSVRTLLERAIARRAQHIYLVGVDRVFDDAWKMALPAAAAASSTEQAILDLLDANDGPGAGKVPADLVRKFLGDSRQAALVRRLILKAAGQHEPVLIVGDTGTGKEVVARAIHEYSDRHIETFVSVNCAAIPQDLFESELFGHEPGAFTGASHRKMGLWKAADRGTLFLDEIGDLRPHHQAKILRSLQEGTVRPVGATSETKVGARVLAATNRDLWAMVQAQRFREDLYYRLCSFFIPTPALRQHPDDIPIIAHAFWRSVTRDPAAALDEGVVRVLMARPWPGNARELKAFLTNLYGLFGKTVQPKHLEAVSRLQSGTTAWPASTDR